MNCPPALVFVFLLLAGCTIGTSTTQRPALTAPAVAPDGTFWDLLEIARSGNAQGFLHLASPRFLHAAFVPLQKIATPDDQQEFNELRKSVESMLAAAAVRNGVDLTAEKTRLAADYMRFLRSLMEERIIDVGVPELEITHKDEFDTAYGPNRAWVTVRLYPKTALPPDFEPQLLRVAFVQDGHRWLIESFDPDPLKASRVWTQ